MDQQFLLLLALHFLTFWYFHSESGRDFMKAIEKSPKRKLLQETFKGYGKALNLLESTRKAIKLDTHYSYFIGVLVIRGSASAFFKQGILSLLLRKPLSLQKPKTNFFITTLPTILIYTCRFMIKHYMHIVFDREWLQEVEEDLIMTFMMFMVTVRLFKIIFKLIRKSSKKVLQAKLKESKATQTGRYHRSLSEIKKDTPVDFQSFASTCDNNDAVTTCTQDSQKSNADILSEDNDELQQYDEV